MASGKPLITSYSSEDCMFLLKPIKAKFQDIENKEWLIQSGQMHYSQFLNPEFAPSDDYMSLFFSLVNKYKTRVAAEAYRIAERLCAEKSGSIAVLSLARAGTPIGVLVARIIRHFFQRNCSHFSLSIIRDRGLDFAALDYVRTLGFSEKNIAFVDGWTAKGVISRELSKSVKLYNHRTGSYLPDALYVIADLSGTAHFAATEDDYAIPSSVLNSTVSGLVSRSILDDQIDSSDFHGCVVYNELAHADRSVWFVDQVFEELLKVERPTSAGRATSQINAVRNDRVEFLKSVARVYGVSDPNRIKPGVAEATRAMLRRVPDLLLLNPEKLHDVAHLLHIAERKGIEIRELREMPFVACTIVKDVSLSHDFRSIK